MKRIFYFAAMALAACTVISCEKEDPKDPGTPGGGDDTTPTKLATPNVKAEVGETEVLVSWEAVANAASYEYTVDNGAATAIEATSVTLAVADLGAGNHTVSVTALPAEGSKDYTKSDAGTCSFNIKEEEGDDPNPPTGDVPEEYAGYVGTWTVTTTQSMIWDDDPENPGYVMPQYVNEPLEFNVDIAYDSESEVLLITGWTPGESAFGQALPLLAAMDAEFGGVQIYSGTQIGTIDEQGTEVLMWLASDVDCQIVSIEQFPAYTLTLSSDGNTITGTPNTLTFNLQGGGTKDITMNSIEIYGYNTVSGELGVYTMDAASPAGSFTMTKSSAGAPTNAPIFDAGRVFGNPVHKANYVLR